MPGKQRGREGTHRTVWGKPAQLVTHQRTAYMKIYSVGAITYVEGYPYDV